MILWRLFGICRAAETTKRDPYEVLYHISYTLYQVEC